MSRETKGPGAPSNQVASGEESKPLDNPSRDETTGLVATGYSAVQIMESTERWTDMLLDDGTFCRIKWSPIKVIRANGVWDAEGNPLYQVSSVPMLIVVQPGPGLAKATQGLRQPN